MDSMPVLGHTERKVMTLMVTLICDGQTSKQTACAVCRQLLANCSSEKETSQKQNNVMQNIANKQKISDAKK